MLNRPYATFAYSAQFNQEKEMMGNIRGRRKRRGFPGNTDGGCGGWGWPVRYASLLLSWLLDTNQVVSKLGLIISYYVRPHSIIVILFLTFSLNLIWSN